MNALITLTGFGCVSVTMDDTEFGDLDESFQTRPLAGIGFGNHKPQGVT